MDDLSRAGASTRDGFSRWSLTIIGICAAIYFLDGLIHTILGPLAPEIAAELGLDNSTLGPVFSANLIGQTIGLLTFPLIASRFGHRIVIVLSVWGFVVAQVATALAWDGQSLFAFRLVDGLFLGGCLPSCLAIVVKVAPDRRKALAVTMLFTGYGSGATMSGIVAAAFVGSGGWRWAILAVGAASALTAVISWFWLRGIDRQEEQEPHAAGTAQTTPRALDVVRSPLLPGTLMLWLMFVSMLIVQYCLSSWLPTLLVEVGREQRFAALSVTIFSLGGIIAALGVGLLMDRFGATRVLVAFLAVATVLLFVIGQVLASASPAVLMALLVAGGFFFLGAYGGVNVVLASYYPEALRAMGIGLTKSVSRAGTIIAPVMIGFGLDAGVRGTTVMSLFAVPAALAGLAIIVVAYVSARGEPGQKEPMIAATVPLDSSSG